MNNPLVIAHRGASSNALENSLTAVRMALSVPADMIEADLRKSRDNRLYVMHDRLCVRTANRNIDIERSTSDRIAGTRLKNGEPIPTLASLFEQVAGKCGLNLELKSAGAGVLTAEYIRASEYKGFVLVSSFKEEEVQAALKSMPELPASLIFDVFPVRKAKSYAARGYKVISLRRKTVNEKLVAACHELGVRVYIWTVDDEEEMRKLISWGVDGIYSNKPGVLKEVMEKFKLQAPT